MGYIRMMKKIFLLIFLFPSILMAHPVDRAVGDAEATALGIAPHGDPHFQPHLSLDDKTFHDLHFEYWHVRREVYEMVARYRECFGARFVMSDMLGQPRSADFHPAIGKYLEFIPAHPLESFAKGTSVSWRNKAALAHINAGHSSIDSMSIHTINCESRRLQISNCIKNAWDLKYSRKKVGELCK